VDILAAVEAMAGRSNVNASSDLEVAARLAGAAARGAAANVMINLPSVGDDRYAGVTRLEVTELIERVDRLTAQVAQTVASGTPREPES
jgi:formiminotetrahydrofolate cyclodeaminase